MIFVYVMRYLFSSNRRVSRDWETVKMLSHETVHRNRIKLVATEKALKSEMLNYCVHSRLGNKLVCNLTEDTAILSSVRLQNSLFILFYLCYSILF